MLRVATLNLNGVRAADRRGLRSWLRDRACDVVGLQELRCAEDALPVGLFDGYHVTHHLGCLAGRNGVALLTRTPPLAVRRGFGHRPSDPEGRYVEVDLAPGASGVALTVGSLYLPKGATHAGPEADPAKYARKLAFMKAFRAYLGRAQRRAAAQGRELLVMGDFNIAHGELDLTRWRTSGRMEGFLPHEREWLGSLLGPRRLVDVVRAMHPETPGPWSWWSWLPGRFDADVGWRIDYQLATPGLAACAVSAGTDRAASAGDRLSDHAPVVVDYDLGGHGD